MPLLEQLHLNPGSSQQGAEFLVRMLFYYPPSTGFSSHLEKRGIEITVKQCKAVALYTIPYTIECLIDLLQL